MALPGREQFRAAVLRYIELPGAKFFRAIKFTPNGITILGFLITVVSAYLVGAGWLVAGGIVFLFAGGLDLMDGALARHTGTASRRGSFTDSVCDQIVVVATTVTLMATSSPIIGIWPGGVYIFVYTMVVVFAMVRNALAVPYSWLVRPRFIVYAWFIIELYLFAGTINYVLWLFNGLLAWKMTTGFLRIRRQI